jgi:hypothetical protein
LTFALYAQEADGAAIWSDEMSVELDHGVFAAYLGENEALSFSDIVAAEELWLEIGVDDEVANERIELGAVPFAYEAEQCRQVVDALCTDGQYLKGWDPDTGAVVCAVPSFAEIVDVPSGLADGDDNTLYTAGVGLALAGGEFSVVQGQIESWAEAVCYDDPDELLAELDDDYVNETGAVTDDMLAGEIDPAKISGTAWTSLNDGAGSGLEADGLDGFHALDFAPVGHDHDADYQRAYRRTIVVSPVGDGADHVANGNALRAALDGIADASESNPYLLKIEPGVYALEDGDGGLVPFVMEPWVDVEGSGQGATRITGPGSTQLYTGTVWAASNAELRDVSLESVGITGSGYATALYVPPGAVARAVRITAIATLANTTSGAFVYQSGAIDGSSTTVFEDSEFVGNCPGSCYGVRAELSGLVVRNSAMTGLSTGTYGGGIRTEAGFTVLRGVTGRGEMTASGRAIGAYNIYNCRVEIYDSSLSAMNGTVENRGIYNDGCDVKVMNTDVEAIGGATVTYGIRSVFSTYTGPFTVEMIGSRVTSSGATISSGATYTTRIAHSVLSGGAVVGAAADVTCAFVVDETYQLFTGICP